MPLEDKESSLKKTLEKNEKEEKIKREAKLILGKFAKALEKIEKVPDSYVERDEDRRKEGSGKESDSDFRRRFFENAPAVKKECIEAERGKWKQEK